MQTWLIPLVLPLISSVTLGKALSFSETLFSLLQSVGDDRTYLTWQLWGGNETVLITVRAALVPRLCIQGREGGVRSHPCFLPPRQHTQIISFSAFVFPGWQVQTSQCASCQETNDGMVSWLTWVPFYLGKSRYARNRWKQANYNCTLTLHMIEFTPLLGCQLKIIPFHNPVPLFRGTRG